MQGGLHLEKSPPKACLSLRLALPVFTAKASLRRGCGRGPCPSQLPPPPAPLGV